MARKTKAARKAKAKTKAPAKRAAVRKTARTSRKAPLRKAAPKPAAKPGKRDALDDFIVAAALALMLPAEKQWLPAIKANLRVTLQHAATVEQFPLPDDAEPAPVFKA